LGTPEFDPHSILPFTVIRLPYWFEGESHAESKLFVVLAHKNKHAICLKATSKTRIYETNAEMMAGCVYYVGGELQCFPQNTAVQPDNQIPIPHYTLCSEERKGNLEIWSLPEDFRKKLIAAVANSTTLTGRGKARLAELGCC